MKEKASILICLMLLVCASSYSQTNINCTPDQLGMQTTPMGRTLGYRRSTSDSTIFHIYLKQGDSEIRIEDDFRCNAAPVTRPWFESENKEYVFLMRGCGAACKVGYLIPTNPSEKIQELYNWLEIDLKSELIVSLDSDVNGLIVKVRDLRYDEEQVIRTSLKCNAAIINGCVAQVDTSERNITITWDEQVSDKVFKLALKN